MLNSIDSLIEALGGPSKAAEKLGLTPPALSNWKARGKIPPEQFENVNAAAKSVGKNVARNLFGFVPPALERSTA